MGKDKASKRSRESLVQDIVQSDAVKRKNRPEKERSRQSDHVDQVYAMKYEVLNRDSVLLLCFLPCCVLKLHVPAFLFDDIQRKLCYVCIYIYILWNKI
jgi:hypothetical protein